MRAVLTVVAALAFSPLAQARTASKHVQSPLLMQLFSPHRGLSVPGDASTRALKAAVCVTEAGSCAAGEAVVVGRSCRCYFEDYGNLHGIGR